MNINPVQNNPNEFKVVKFKNITDFDFTPELGAMYDSRPFFVKAGETISMPYPVGIRLAKNLAKAIFVKKAPAPQYEKENDKTTGVLFSDEDIRKLVSEILVDEYQESRPAALSETDRMMQKFEELNKTVEALKEQSIAPQGYKDKAEVIAELDKRGIKYDARSTKANLEKLLA